MAECFLGGFGGGGANKTLEHAIEKAIADTGMLVATKRNGYDYSFNIALSTPISSGYVKTTYKYPNSGIDVSTTIPFVRNQVGLSLDPGVGYAALSNDGLTVYGLAYNGFTKPTGGSADHNLSVDVYQVS